MTAPDLIDAAADWLDTHGWIQGQIAINKLGQACLATGPHAASACAMGALFLAVGPGNITLLSIIASDVCSAWLDMPLETFNDAEGRTKAEVINALRTIAAAERAGCARP
jgi:hypothetical protein